MGRLRGRDAAPGHGGMAAAAVETLEGCDGGSRALWPTHGEAVGRAAGAGVGGVVELGGLVGPLGTCRPGEEGHEM